MKQGRGLPGEQKRGRAAGQQGPGLTQETTISTLTIKGTPKSGEKGKKRRGGIQTERTRCAFVEEGGVLFSTGKTDIEPLTVRKKKNGGKENSQVFASGRERHNDR